MESEKNVITGLGVGRALLFCVLEKFDYLGGESK